MASLEGRAFVLEAEGSCIARTLASVFLALLALGGCLVALSCQ